MRIGKLGRGDDVVGSNTFHVVCPRHFTKVCQVDDPVGPKPPRTTLDFEEENDVDRASRGCGHDNVLQLLGPFGGKGLGVLPKKVPTTKPIRTINHLGRELRVVAVSEREELNFRWRLTNQHTAAPANTTPPVFQHSVRGRHNQEGLNRQWPQL